MCSSYCARCSPESVPVFTSRPLSVRSSPIRSTPLGLPEGASHQQNQRAHIEELTEYRESPKTDGLTSPLVVVIGPEFVGAYGGGYRWPVDKAIRTALENNRGKRRYAWAERR